MSEGVHGNQKCSVQRPEVPRSPAGKSRGHRNEELRVYYPAFCPAGALPVLRGIAALFRCQAERQVNLVRLGIEAILCSASVRTSGTILSHSYGRITWLSDTSTVQARGAVLPEAISARGRSDGSRRLQFGIKRPLRRPQQTLLVGGFLIGNRCPTLPPTEVGRSRHFCNRPAAASCSCGCRSRQACPQRVMCAETAFRSTNPSTFGHAT